MKKMTPVQVQRKAAHDAVIERVRQLDEQNALDSLNLTAKEIKKAQRAVGFDLGPEEDDFAGQTVSVRDLFRG